MCVYNYTFKIYTILRTKFYLPSDINYYEDWRSVTVEMYCTEILNHKIYLLTRYDFLPIPIFYQFDLKRTSFNVYIFFYTLFRMAS